MALFVIKDFHGSVYRAWNRERVTPLYLESLKYCQLQYSTFMIDKAYPFDFMQRGRVRVLLKKEDGTLYNPAISSTSWKQQMLHVAELVPRHPGWTKKQEPPSTSVAGHSKSRKGGNTG